MFVAERCCTRFGLSRRRSRVRVPSIPVLSFGLIPDPDADAWGVPIGWQTVLRRNALLTHVSLVGHGANRGTVIDSAYDREREMELLRKAHRRSLRREASDHTRLYRLQASGA